MKAFVLALALFATAFAAAQESPTTAPVTLTFDQAMRRALEVNNAIETARSEVDVTDAGRRQILSAVFPRITATGSGTRNSTEVSFGEGSDSRTILAQNDWNYRVVLSQPIFAGRRELRAYEQAKLFVRNAEQGQRGTEDAVLLRVASNYLAVVNADARAEVERRNMALAEKRREQALSFFEAGEATKVDVLRAETAIKAAQRVLAFTDQLRETATGRLRADLDINAPLQVASPQHDLPAPPPESSLVAMAEESRPDIRLAANNLRIASLEIAKQRGFWLPVITFDGGWVQQKSQFPSDSYSYASLRFNVPLLQSGEVEARVAGAKARELQARLALQDARTAAREDVRKALVDLRAAETSLGLAGEQLVAAEAEYAQAFELYRAQETTALDLSASETSLAEARRAVAEETLNRDLAELRVWYAAGAMKHAVGVGNGS